MRVLAVDPGYDRIGIAVLEHGRPSEKLVFSLCIETDKKTPISERLHTLGNEFRNLLSTYTPDAVAVEKLFFNKNQKTAMAVAEARGIIIFLAQDVGCTIYEFGPQEIKIAVTGHGRSEKKQVIDMVQRLIPEAPKQALDDEYDAIAVGITCLAHHRGQ